MRVTRVGMVWIGGVAVLACGGAGGAPLAEPIPMPSQATVTVIDVGEGEIVSVSPSGEAQLVLKRTPEPWEDGVMDVQWCLRERGETKRCLTSTTQEVRCLGGGHSVSWRNDEQAVVICGEQLKISGDFRSARGMDSVLDFATGTVVVLDPRNQPMVTPFWTRDGTRLLAFEPDGKPHRPWYEKDRAPITIDPFVAGFDTRPASEDADALGPIWITHGRGAPGAMLLEPPTMERQVIDVTDATQDAIDVTPDGRLAVFEDDQVDKGHDGILWHLIDRETRTVTPIPLPADAGDGLHAQISDAGTRILALWTGADRKLHLGITADRGASWHTLHRWTRGDPGHPSRYHGEGELFWNGGPVAWVVTRDNGLARVDLK